MSKIKFIENHALRKAGTVEEINVEETVTLWQRQGKIEILRDDRPASMRKGPKGPPRDKEIKAPPESKGLSTDTAPINRGGRPRGRGRGR